MGERQSFRTTLDSLKQNIIDYYSEGVRSENLQCTPEFLSQSSEGIDEKGSQSPRMNGANVEFSYFSDFKKPSETENAYMQRVENSIRTKLKLPADIELDINNKGSNGYTVEFEIKFCALNELADSLSERFFGQKKTETVEMVRTGEYTSSDLIGLSLIAYERCHV